MLYRPLGSTALRVSAIGFGGWGIGGRTAGETSYGDVDDDVCRAALNAAYDAGITFYDTAPAYGDGHSEELIGETFADRRSNVVIASKAGYEGWTRHADFSSEGILRSLTSSLLRLQTDYLDLLQLHNAPIDLLRSQPGILRTLRDLCDAGTIKSWGLSVKSPAEGIEAIREFSVPVIQSNFNMLDMRADTSGLLSLAQEQGVGFIARTPLCFGFLGGSITPETTFSEGDHRNAWSRAQRMRWLEGAAEMMAVIKDHTEEEMPAQSALRFCLTPSAVSVVLPGILRPEEAQANARAARLGPISNDEYSRIRTINNRTNFFIPRPSASNGGMK